MYWMFDVMMMSFILCGLSWAVFRGSNRSALNKFGMGMVIFRGCVRARKLHIVQLRRAEYILTSAPAYAHAYAWLLAQDVIRSRKVTESFLCMPAPACNVYLRKL